MARARGASICFEDLVELRVIANLLAVGIALRRPVKSARYLSVHFADVVRPLDAPGSGTSRCQARHMAVMLLFRADRHDQLARPDEGPLALELAERSPHLLPSGVAPRAIERRQHLM